MCDTLLNLRIFCKYESIDQPSLMLVLLSYEIILFHEILEELGMSHLADEPLVLWQD